MKKAWPLSPSLGRQNTAGKSQECQEADAPCQTWVEKKNTSARVPRMASWRRRHVCWASGEGLNLHRREARDGHHENGEQKGAVRTLEHQAGLEKSRQCRT